jgi:hypothetical protein
LPTNRNRARVSCGGLNDLKLAARHLAYFVRHVPRRPEFSRRRQGLDGHGSACGCCHVRDVRAANRENNRPINSERADGHCAASSTPHVAVRVGARNSVTLDAARRRPIEGRARVSRCTATDGALTIIVDSRGAGRECRGNDRRHALPVVPHGRRGAEVSRRQASDGRPAPILAKRALRDYALPRRLVRLPRRADSAYLLTARVRPKRVRTLAIIIRDRVT